MENSNVTTLVQKNKRENKKWSLWSHGDLTIGERNSKSLKPREITTSGLTLGMDRKLNNDKFFGLALRYGNEDIDILRSSNKFETEDGTTSDELISKKRARFYLYTQEYDKRRNTSLLLNFPEMENFLNTCEKEWNKWKSHEGDNWKH